MIGIKKNLLDDEEILWKYSEERNLLKETIAHLIIGIFLIAFLLISIIMISSTLVWMTWYIILLLIAIPTLLFIRTIFAIIKDYKKKSNYLNLTWKELRKYKCVYIITNKRWIQKDYDLNSNIDISKYSTKVLEKSGDIIFVNMESIQVIYTYEDNGYTILFYIDYDEDNLEDSNLGVLLSSMEFIKAIKTLKEVIPLKKEKQDEFGGTIFYRK